MTAEARSATVPPGPGNVPCCGRTSPRQRWRSGLTSRGHHASMRTSIDPVRDDPAVIDLVTRARNGDKQAWDALVERYATLIWSICRRHRLGGGDAEDAGQSVWLQLVAS